MKHISVSLTINDVFKDPALTAEKLSKTIQGIYKSVPKGVKNEKI